MSDETDPPLTDLATERDERSKDGRCLNVLCGLENPISVGYLRWCSERCHGHVIEQSQRLSERATA